MANAAAKLPANAEGTHYDIGRSVALWVSAFEILVHSGNSGLLKVYDNFDNAEWKLTECKEKKYEAHGRKKGEPRRSLACWVYGKIHKGRNDFLHGNPITTDTLLVRESIRPAGTMTGLRGARWTGTGVALRMIFRTFGIMRCAASQEARVRS